MSDSFRSVQGSPSEKPTVCISDINARLRAVELNATSGIMGEVTGGHQREFKDIYTVAEAENDRKNACIDAERAFKALLKECGLTV